MKYFWILGILFTFIACKDKKTATDEDTFKKTELLQQVADNYILPEYAKLQSEVTALATTASSFEAVPSITSFDSLKAQWKRAYIRFQYVKMFDFGPGMEQNLDMSLGTVPTDSATIEHNITSGSYNLSEISNYDAIGFPALDYLLFSANAFEAISTSTSRKKYLVDVTQKMKNEVDKTVSSWNSYRTTFVDGTSNASTSPFSLLMNNFIRDYEILKWTKLGYPLGVNTLNVKNPAYLEARKSGIGKELLRANILALQQVYLGKGSNGKDGKSMHDYLVALGKTTTATTIQTNWGVFQTQIEALPTSLETALNSDTQKMIDLYNAIHFNTIALKTDMVSAFGVLITYSDNDGD
jgi:predicted lipoprotein